MLSPCQKFAKRAEAQVMPNPRVSLKFFFVLLTPLKITFRLLRLLSASHGAISGSQWLMRKYRMDCRINLDFRTSVQRRSETFFFRLGNNFVIRLFLKLGRLLRCRKSIPKAFAKIGNSKLNFLQRSCHNALKWVISIGVTTSQKDTFKDLGDSFSNKKNSF